MKKSTIIAVVVFVGLLVGVVLSLNNKAERGITRVSLGSVDISKIDRITIAGKNPIEMKRDGERWILADGREADEFSVKQLRETLPKIESSDMVTKDAARFDELEVTDEKGLKVTGYAQNQVVTEFTVGKSVPAGTHIRIGDAVYMVKKIYQYVFSKQSSAWHNLKLFKAKLEEVTRVEMTPASGPAYALVKKDDKWAFDDPKVVPPNFRFDANAASSLVSELVNLRAQEIVLDNPGADKTGLEKGYDVLVFVDKAGGRNELRLGAAAEKDNTYGQVVGGKDIQLLSKYSMRNLRKTPTDLRDLKMIELKTEKVTKLSIQDGKTNLVLTKQGAQWKIDKSSEKVPGDFELDEQQVQRRLQALANIRAMKVSDETSPAKTGLGKPEAVVKATLDDGSVVQAVFGGQTKANDSEVVYSVGNIDKDIYLVYKGTRTNLTGGLDTFKKRPMPQGGPNIDPQALSKLPPDVRQGLMNKMMEKKKQDEMIKAVQSQIKAKEEKKATQ